MCPERTEEEVLPWERPGAFRRDGEPHRGLLILSLGQASMVCSLLAYCPCLFFVAPLGVALGLAAWLLGRRDLAGMRVGLVDPAGEPPTKLGRDRGIEGLVVGVCPMLFWGGLILFELCKDLRRW